MGCSYVWQGNECMSNEVLMFGHCLSALKKHDEMTFAQFAKNTKESIMSFPSQRLAMGSVSAQT